jgi:hypothetical protein
VTGRSTLGIQKGNYLERKAKTSLPRNHNQKVTSIKVRRDDISERQKGEEREKFLVRVRYFI